MGRRILITAGPVYSNLDDNKILTNRTRGIWAQALGRILLGKGYEVTLLVPDTFPIPEEGPRAVVHRGYHEYAALCEDLAPSHDCAIMAAAVLNFIPANPVKGKMSTAGIAEGEIINIPFILAPRVINRMKEWNPKITLIGCKLLSGATHDELIEAAYLVVLAARCNAVIANDLSNLKTKHVVYQDRTVRTFNNDWTGLYDDLIEIIEDEHFRTTRFTPVPGTDPKPKDACETFDRLVNENRDRFLGVETGLAFGAVAVHVRNQGWLVSPREKGRMFTSKDATLVSLVDWAKREVHVPEGWNKATLNAPLLIRYAAHFMHKAVLHFHEQVPRLPTLPYAPPGTLRDNYREFTDDMRDGFNIEGHGCVIAAK